jgi:hypothetical protein
MNETSHIMYERDFLVNSYYRCVDGSRVRQKRIYHLGFTSEDSFNLFVADKEKVMKTIQEKILDERNEEIISFIVAYVYYDPAIFIC